MKLARRMGSIEPSATLAVTSKAAALKADGVDIISFGAGEPDFDTPPHVIEAAKRALDQGWTRYTPAAGLPALKQAVVDHVQRHFGLGCTPAQVVTSCGGKHTLYNAMMALINPGDGVLLPAPYWVSYPEQIKLAGGEIQGVDCRVEDNFRLDLEALEAARTPATRGLIINSPSNPTGAAYTRADLDELADFVRKHDLWVISDEIYARLTYDGYQSTWFSTLPGMAERTVTVYGLSKTYAMTGWRVGIGIAPEHVAEAMTRLQGQVTTNIPAVCQAGAIAALREPDDFLQDWIAQFDARRRLMVERLNAMPGVHCNLPQGAFYAFPDLRGLLGKAAGDRVMHTDWDLVDYLLDEAHVALVPGDPFGAPGFARLSYSTSLETIKRGLDRMAEALARLT